MNDTQHWHDRAAEIRVLVKQMKVIEWRLFKLASDYDRFADRAEERAKTGAPAPSPIRERGPINLRPGQLDASSSTCPNT
jgi:hypothetical protein